jgi:hypothetical protein
MSLGTDGPLQRAADVVGRVERVYELEPNSSKAVLLSKARASASDRRLFVKSSRCSHHDPRLPARTPIKPNAALLGSDASSSMSVHWRLRSLVNARREGDGLNSGPVWDDCRRPRRHVWGRDRMAEKQADTRGLRACWTTHRVAPLLGPTYGWGWWSSGRGEL